MTRICRALAVLVSAVCAGCGAGPEIASILPPSDDTTIPDGATLVTRLVHISDAQLPDEESPARLTSFAGLWAEAWRPHYAYIPHFVDGGIRAINRTHVAESPIDFVVHTGDAVDNVQANELDWFMALMDGGPVNPLTGVDDRPPDERPAPLLDPHAPFTAQGLYQEGVHGPLPSIPWYAVTGNHDRFASGVFTIVDFLGFRYAPVALDNRPGLFLPNGLFPQGSIAWGPLSPAHPEPPTQLDWFSIVQPNPDRRYFTIGEFIEAHLASPTMPPGHGFSADAPNRTWYSTSPAPGIRLITLDSATPSLPLPRYFYSEAAISLEQARFLRDELDMAEQRGEWVIVATHHPSASLETVYGSALVPTTVRALLAEHPCVKLHLCGHLHSGLVIQRDGYMEIVTGALMDWPHDGRIIEIYRNGDEAVIRYHPVADDDYRDSPDAAHEPMFTDPYRQLRTVGRSLSETFRSPL